MSTDLVVQPELTPTLFGTANPGEVVERAAVVAKTLADLVHRQSLVVRIGQSDHVRVEGWTLLGSMLGVFPVVEWTRPVRDSDDAQIGWEARVEARTRGGEIVGAAEAECLRSERTWKSRDDYALRSMAQTRAVSKALRLPLGFVMQLAGFDPTPADEMPVIEGRVVDDPAEDVPFGDVAPPLADEVVAEKNDPLAKRKKKLDVIVKGKLKPPLRKVWTTVARMRGVTTDTLIADLGGIEDDGELHWTPLRDAMTAGEMDSLIDKLEKLSPFQPPPEVQAKLEAGA